MAASEGANYYILRSNSLCRGAFRYTLEVKPCSGKGLDFIEGVERLPGLDRDKGQYESWFASILPSLLVTVPSD
jgi:hypothetical protein